MVFHFEFKAKIKNLYSEVVSLKNNVIYVDFTSKNRSTSTTEKLTAGNFFSSLIERFKKNLGLRTKPIDKKHQLYHYKDMM